MVTSKLRADLKIYVSPQTVARWARELGRNRPVGQQRYLELPPLAKDLYESGMNLERVAKRFHVGRTLAAKRPIS